MRVSQYWITSSGLTPARADSCQPSGCLPSERTRPRSRRTYDAYASSGIPRGSSAPMCRYGPGKIAATWARTCSISPKVAGSPGSSQTARRRWPGRNSYSTSFRPDFRSGRSRSSAVVCPGVSISGTIVTKRSAA